MWYLVKFPGLMKTFPKYALKLPLRTCSTDEKAGIFLRVAAVLILKRALHPRPRQQLDVGTETPVVKPLSLENDSRQHQPPNPPSISVINKLTKNNSLTLPLQNRIAEEILLLIPRHTKIRKSQQFQRQLKEVRMLSYFVHNNFLLLREANNFAKELQLQQFLSMLINIHILIINQEMSLYVIT